MLLTLTGHSPIAYMATPVHDCQRVISKKRSVGCGVSKTPSFCTRCFGASSSLPRRLVRTGIAGPIGSNRKRQSNPFRHELKGKSLGLRIADGAEGLCLTSYQPTGMFTSFGDLNGCRKFPAAWVSGSVTAMATTTVGLQAVNRLELERLQRSPVEASACFNTGG